MRQPLLFSVTDGTHRKVDGATIIFSPRIEFPIIAATVESTTDSNGEGSALVSRDYSFDLYTRIDGQFFASDEPVRHPVVNGCRRQSTRLFPIKGGKSDEVSMISFIVVELQCPSSQ